jgi:hypothetical protein
MFAAEPRRFLPATPAAEGGEMRSSNFKSTPHKKMAFSSHFIVSHGNLTF